MPELYPIRAVTVAELPSLVSYLLDQLSDNGRDGTPIFQPQARGAAWPAAEKVAQFQHALAAPVGEAGWRRFWVATDSRGEIAGHADLRARPDPCAEHRALLGMGVHRDHRRRGVGRALISALVAWARESSGLEWIDLEVIETNEPARALYRAAGFRELATVPDMFRIDGQSFGHVLMTRAVRGA